MWYAISKLCSKCGSKKNDLKLKDRVYKCNSCGAVLCRDLNSSLNLSKVNEENITNRVGSIRINACGHETADGHEKSCSARKQEVNTLCG